MALFRGRLLVSLGREGREVCLFPRFGWLDGVQGMGMGMGAVMLPFHSTHHIYIPRGVLRMTWPLISRHSEQAGNQASPNASCGVMFYWPGLDNSDWSQLRNSAGFRWFWIGQLAV
jgi:hypothetical protein